MPPLRSRSGMAHMGAVTSMVAVASAAVFAAAEGLVPANTEPIVVGASVAGMGLVFLYLARKIMATSELVKETHYGLFNEHTGVFTVLTHHERRADRHSGEIRAIRDGAD